MINKKFIQERNELPQVGVEVLLTLFEKYSAFPEYREQTLTMHRDDSKKINNLRFVYLHYSFNK